MQNILPIFSRFTVAKDKQLKCIVNAEKYITDLLKDLKFSEAISGTIYKSLKPRVSKFGIL